MDDAAKALTLPKAAQEGILEGLGKAIEALSGLLDLAKSAQLTDDAAAPVPPEFAEQIERTGMMIAALGDQFEGGTGDMGGDAGGGPPLSGEEMALAKMVAKGVAKGLVQLGARVAKGKIKMSFEAAMKLHSGLMAKLFDIANDLAPMLNDIGGGGPPGPEVAAALGAGAPEDEAAKAAKAAAETAKAAEVAKALAAGGGGDVAKALARIESGMNGLAATVQKVAKTRPAPSVAVASALEGAPAPSADRIPYGENLSQRQRDKDAAGAGSPAAPKITTGA